MTNSIKISELKKGDVLLYRGTSWLGKAIQWFDDSEVSHAAIYIGDNLVAEAVINGVVARDVKLGVEGQEWVKSFQLANLPQDMGPVLRRAQEILDAKERYGFEQLLLLAFLCTTRKLKMRPGLRAMVRAVLDAAADRLTPLFEFGKEPMICSEFVYRAYNEADPAATDAYTIIIRDTEVPPSDAMEPRAMQRAGVHPESLAALFAAPASRAWIEPAPERPPADAVAAPDQAALDALIQAYLEPPETRAERDAYEEISLEQLRSATDLFAIKLYKAATLRERPAEGDAVQDKAAEREAAYQFLFDTAANFVTPGDLYTSPSLTCVGNLDLP